MSGLPIGLVTLGEMLPDPHTGIAPTEAARLREIVAHGVLADELGMRSFHVGEHHFGDYFVSSPTPVLAAVAERTSTVRLSTAVSLLPHHDPVRIAEDYAMVDALSGGRVEIIGGRGVDLSVYGQFGQAHEQSEQRLVEAVGLLRQLWTTEHVDWTGTIRPPLTGITTRPRPVQPQLPLWLSASSPASAERAAALGCPIVIPTVSTGVSMPVEIARAFRAAWSGGGRAPAEGKVVLHVHCFVGAGTTEEAIEQWRPHQSSYLEWVFSTLRPGNPLPGFLSELGTPTAQAVCGSAERVTDELNGRIEAMGGVDGLLIQVDHGGIGQARAEASVRRFMADVAPHLHGTTASAAGA